MPTRDSTLSNPAASGRARPGGRHAARRRLWQLALATAVTLLAPAAFAQASTFDWVGSPALHQVATDTTSLRLNFSFSNQSNVVIRIEGPDNTLVEQITPSAGTNFATNACFVTNRDPWDWYCELTYSNTNPSASGFLNVTFRSRNGAHDNRAGRTFAASFTSSQSGTGTPVTHTVQFTSAPASNVTTINGTSSEWRGVWGGVAGEFRRRDVAISETGNGHFERVDLTIQVPAAGVLVARTPGPWAVLTDLASGSSGTMTARFNGSVGVLGALVGPAPGPLGSPRSSYSIPNLTVAEMRTPPFSYVYFVPCPNSHTSTWTLVGSRPNTSGDQTPQSVQSSATSLVQAAQCNAPLTNKFTPTGNGSYAAGAPLTYLVQVLPPVANDNGQAALEDVMVVDRLPDEVEFVGLDLSGLESLESSATAYVCAVAASADADARGVFDAAVFADLLAQGDCAPLDVHTYPPDDITHVVVVVPAWLETVDGYLGSHERSFEIDTRIDTDAPTGLIYNHACTSGTADAAPFGNSMDAPLLAYPLLSIPPGCVRRQTEVDNDAYPGVTVFADRPASGTTTPDSVFSPGDTADFLVRFRADEGPDLVFAPGDGLSVVVPAGFQVQSISQINPCEPDEPTTVTTDFEDDPPNPTVVTFLNTGAAPFSVRSCGRYVNSQDPTALGGFRIRTTVRTDFPFVHQATIPVSASLSIANPSTAAGYTNPATAQTQVSVLNPAELDLAVADGGCEGGYELVLATIRNRGGAPAQVELRIPTPAGLTFQSTYGPGFVPASPLPAFSTSTTVIGGLTYGVLDVPALPAFTTLTFGILVVNPATPQTLTASATLNGSLTSSLPGFTTTDPALCPPDACAGQPDGTECDADDNACTIDRCSNDACAPTGQSQTCAAQGPPLLCSTPLCDPTDGLCDVAQTTPPECGLGGAYFAIELSGPGGQQAFALCRVLSPSDVSNPFGGLYTWSCIPPDPNAPLGAVKVFTPAEVSAIGADFCPSLISLNEPQ